RCASRPTSTEELTMSSVHDRRRRERWPLVAAALALAALGAPLGAQAADQNTASNGGNGGSSFTARCGAGLALRGVHGRVGDWWDHVQGDCLLVNADGSPAAGPPTTASEGTSSGQVPVNALCPAGQVMSGIGVAARPVPFVGEFVWA